MLVRHKLPPNFRDVNFRDVKKEMGNGRGTEDEEVGNWVKSAIERKKSGLMGTSAKPALHAAPLDSVSPAASPG